MNACQDCQAKLLDHLYGLLDDADARTVEDHLKACPACGAALATARQQRDIISIAAKGQFPGVRFAPPAAQPVTVALQVQPVPRRSWRRWALAAGIVLAVTGLGLTGGLSWYAHSQEAAQARLEQTRLAHAADLQAQRERADRERTRRELDAVQEEIRQLEARWNGEVEKVKKASAAKDVQVIVTGPRAVQPGAPNVYQIETRRQGPPKRGARPLIARLLDVATNKELARQPLRDGTTKWELPQNLPVKPGAQLSLLVTEEVDISPKTAAHLIGAAVPGTSPAPLATALVLSAREGKRTHVSETLQLVGSLFVTHVTTDRPMYRPGEVVHFRSLTLERFSLKPGQEDFQLRYRVTDPRGGEVFKLDGVSRVADEKDKNKTEIVGPDGKPVRGLGAGEWRIPPGAAGGEYMLTVSEAHNRFPPERRKFLVNNYQAPRLNKEIEFTRKSYGPGDVVEVNCKVARAEGGLPADGEFVFPTAQVDGQACAILDAGALRLRKGEVTVRFQLPAKMERGDGSLSVLFADGGTRETIVRPIPIVLKKLFVEFYPEGGDLVAGAPNRVYFTARTTLGKPAELQGRLVDGDGKEIVTVRTLNDDKEAGVNQGMGRFEFTPQAGKKYELKIDVPIGIESRHALPAARDSGVVLATADGVFAEQLGVSLTSAGAERKLLVGAYCRGRLLDQARATVKAGETIKLKLSPAAGVGGVYRVTVFEERAGQQLVPVAERLVYRHPVERLNLAVSADKATLSPGGKGNVTIKATDENGRPAPFIALVSVVDLSIRKLADEKTARSMPTHFFLSTEIKEPEELEYADFLVGPHPKAAAALDLLLGTQGWRRFAEQQDPGLFRQREKQNADRLLLATGRAIPEQTNLAELQKRKVDQTFAAQWLAKEHQLAAREKQAEKAQQEAAQEQARLQRLDDESMQAAAAAAERLREYKARLLNYTLGGLAVGLLVVGIVALIVGIVRLSNGHPRAMRSFITGISSLCVLFLCGLVGLMYYAANRAFAPGARMEAAQAEAKMAVAFGAPRPPMAPGGGGEGRAMDKADVLLLGEMAPKKEMPPKEAEKFRLADAQGDDAKLVKKAMLPPDNVGVPRAVNPDEPVGIVGGKAEKRFKKFEEREVADVEQRPKKMKPPPRLPGLQADWDDGFAPGAGPMAGERRWDERQLRKQGRFEQLAQIRLGLDHKRLAVIPTAGPFVVREYAHKHLPAADNVRRDFAETLYWHPVLVVPGGKKTDLTFDLSDAVTRFEVLVWAHTLDGRLGAASTEIASRLPFSVEPRIPIEVTRSDKITVPVVVTNDTDKSLSVEVGVQAKGLTVQGADKKQFAVDPGKRPRQLFSFQPSIVEGEASLRFTGKSMPLGADSVERSFRIVPEGFPVVGAKSDLLEKVARHEIVLPETWVPGTMKMQVQVFPSTLADLQKGLESLLREPCGCFEQSSSSNYPNVLILSYLKESEQAAPQLEKRARGLLTSGYQKLTSFECMDPTQASKRRGYEWFGQTAPPHEALTAYGLLQFRDMAKVHPVDKAMVERTQKYLLARRDGKGGFTRNPRALDSFGRAPDHVTNAYIVWALTEGGAEDDLSTELKALYAAAKDSKDPYFVALVGLGHLNRGKSEEALGLLKALRGAQQKDGRLTGAAISITGSGGRDLEIETTALATLGWLRANRPADFNDNVQKAARWIGQQRGGYGGFGSTQSTILALKALIAFTHDNKKVPVDSELVLEVNGERVSKKFAAGSREELVLAVPHKGLLKPGKNVVSVSMDKNTLPYTLTWSYRTLKPANVEKCPVRLTTKLDRDRAEEGETVRLTAVVENRSGKGQGMAVAILGLPSGLAVPENMQQLKDMVRLREDGTKPGLISAFEIRGRELVLYWRDLAPDQRIEVGLDLVCRLPGEYRGPASRAYLYYNADNKFWVEPLAVAIAPTAK